jgi:hypothetical protein
MSYQDIYNTRYRLFFSDIDGNPKRLDIDQKNYPKITNVNLSSDRIQLSDENDVALNANSLPFINEITLNNSDYNAIKNQTIGYEFNTGAFSVNGSIGYFKVLFIDNNDDINSIVVGVNDDDETISFQYATTLGPNSSETKGITNIVGTGNPVVINYSSGDILKKNIFGSKMTINLFKQFDDEFVPFHEFPENEFKIRLYNGINKFQYHKLNILCPTTNFLTNPDDLYNYRERITNVEDNYICEVPDNFLNDDFQEYATNKSKFIERVLYDSGVIENEDAILSNDFEEIKEPYFQMYWQGYLVADTFKESFKPYPYKIQLTALDMLATIDNFKINPYGYNRLGGEQSYGSDLMSNQTFDTIDILGRYFLNQPISPSNYTGQSPNLVGPIDSLYQYIFVEMDNKTEGVDIVQTTRLSGNFNYTGFSDRFTYLGTSYGRDNTIGQDGIFDTNYNVLDGKAIVNNLLRYKNARIYQSWGQVVVSLIGTNNRVVRDAPSAQNAVTGSLAMNFGLSADITNYMKNPTAHTKKYYKIAQREQTGTGTLRGMVNYIGFFGQPMSNKVRQDLQPIKNDFKVEYLAPLKDVAIEIDRSMLNLALGQVAANPSMEYDSGFDVNNGSIKINDNPRSGRKSYSTTSYYNNNPPQNSSGLYTVSMRTDQRTFNQYGQDQRLRAPIGTPEISVSMDYYVACDTSNVSQIPEIRLYYFCDLDTREVITQSITDRDYYYDQKDRRWEKSTRLNFVELKGATDFNKWNTLTITVDEYDLYSGQPDGIQFVRGEIGFLATVIRNNGAYASKYQKTYLDNIRSNVNYFEPKKEIVTLQNVASRNTKRHNMKIIPWRTINERGGNFDYEYIESSGTTNQYQGALISKAQEILSLYSAYVKRYEFTARPKRNWFAMSNQLYINFDNYKDDAISYVDGIKINVKNNEYKIIAHKGMIQELGQFDTSARVETS